MGTIQHQAILVTGSNYSENLLDQAYDKAIKLFPGLVSNKIQAITNGYISFFIAPCGSKLGWPEAKKHDKNIKEFVTYLHSLKYGDGSTSVKFVYVSFGELGFSTRRRV